MSRLQGIQKMRLKVYLVGSYTHLFCNETQYAVARQVNSLRGNRRTFRGWVECLTKKFNRATVVAVALFSGGGR